MNCSVFPSMNYMNKLLNRPLFCFSVHLPAIPSLCTPLLCREVLWKDGQSIHWQTGNDAADASVVRGIYCAFRPLRRLVFPPREHIDRGTHFGTKQPQKGAFLRRYTPVLMQFSSFSLLIFFPATYFFFFFKNHPRP